MDKGFLAAALDEEESARIQSDDGRLAGGSGRTDCPRR